MKTLIKYTLFLLAFACMGAPAYAKPKHELKFKTPVELINAYLDENVEPKKGPLWWAIQFVLMFQKEASFKKDADFGQQFNPQLIKYAKLRNATRIAGLFVIFQHKFPEAMKKIIKDKGLPAVKEIIEKRCKVSNDEDESDDSEE